MHYIISSIILILIMYKVNKTLNQKENKPVYISEKDYKKQQIEIEKTEKQREKAMQQAKKEKQQTEKTRQKKEQAESDILFFEGQYEILYELARQVEADIQELTKQIKIDKLMHSYDRAKTKENKLYQLTKKQVSIENQLYSMQCRINKAKHIVRGA